MANRNNEWAENEFGDAVLGDKRLTDRLVNIADSFTNPNYGLASKERHRNRGLFRLHGIGNQNRKNMN